MLFRTSRRSIPGAHGTAAETHCTGHRTQTAPEDEKNYIFAVVSICDHTIICISTVFIFCQTALIKNLYSFCCQGYSVHHGLSAVFLSPFLCQDEH